MSRNVPDNCLVLAKEAVVRSYHASEERASINITASEYARHRHCVHGPRFHLGAGAAEFSKISHRHVGAVAQGLEQGRRRGVVRLDECGDDADALSADGRVAGGYQGGGDPATLSVRVDGQSVDPSLATVMCAQDHTHDPLSNRRDKVEVGELFELMEKRGLALPAMDFKLHAADRP